jgi:hypothetical protein
MLGRSSHDGFSVARLDGKVWVWLPVRLAGRQDAEQWITQRMAQDELEAKTRTPEVSEVWRQKRATSGANAPRDQATAARPGATPGAVQAGRALTVRALAKPAVAL